MSLLSRAIMFALKEVVGAAASEIGQHVGDAAGTLLGRKIDPEHGKHDDDDDEIDDEDCDCDECNPDEDEE